MLFQFLVAFNFCLEEWKKHRFIFYKTAKQQHIQRDLHIFFSFQIIRMPWNANCWENQDFSPKASIDLTVTSPLHFRAYMLIKKRIMKK